MVVPKRNDRLIQHFMSSQKQKDKQYNSTEESEFHALDWDFKKGVKLLPHKLERYLELKKKLGK